MQFAAATGSLQIHQVTSEISDFPVFMEYIYGILWKNNQSSCHYRSLENNEQVKCVMTWLCTDISVLSQEDWRVNAIKKLGKEYSCLNSLLLSWQNFGAHFIVLETQPLPTALLEKGSPEEILLKR